MKIKTIFFLIALISALTFCSCAAANNKIEAYEWKLRSASYIEGGQLTVIATDKPDDYPNAEFVNVTLMAQNGTISIYDATNDKSFTGSYKLKGINPSGREYSISINGQSGHAAVAYTTYLDGKKEPTLPISIGSYTLYFYCR